MARPAADALSRALDRYEAVIEQQGVARLAELDRWYRVELPALLARRHPRYVTRPELVRITEWKMARGVWRAPNLALVRSNAAADVERTSRDAFAAMPDPSAPIAALAKLKGVGPATASAVVAAAAPEVYPFFDELVAGQLAGLGPVAWTPGYYAKYADALRAWSGELGAPWTPGLLERALWAHVGGKAGHG
jgi:hypothetical protein